MPGLSLNEMKQLYPRFRNLIDEICDVSHILDRLDRRLHNITPLQPKQANQFMTYPYTENEVDRTSENDRAFPLEMVALQQFRTNHDSDIEGAMIHTGPYANEMARSFNAFALTIGRDIFFRDRAYDPGSEEGRKTLVHELTHVTQYQENGLLTNSSPDEVEAEAEESEQQEEYDKDVGTSIVLNGNRYWIPLSETRRYAKMAAKITEDWIQEQKKLLDEDEYLVLLNSYNEWVGGKISWPM
jgi:hypothetical protein